MQTKKKFQILNHKSLKVFSKILDENKCVNRKSLKYKLEAY